MSDTSHGILLCDDLIFTSRVQGEAKAQGLTLRCVKSAEALLRSSQPPPRCVIMDLNTPGLDIDAVVKNLESMSPRPQIVGYGSHVDAATLARARSAGCDVVWPRSKFADELARSLPAWFAAPDAS